MLYSFISSAAPSKYLSQTYLSNSARFGARVKTPEASSASTSSLSFSNACAVGMVRQNKTGVCEEYISCRVVMQARKERIVNADRQSVNRVEPEYETNAYFHKLTLIYMFSLRGLGTVTVFVATPSASLET